MFTNVKRKKGFTLVELIVVLVILAILAALLVPALTGYIDKAKEKKIVAETRMVVMAVQTVASETYGSLNNLDDDDPTEWATIPTIGGNQGKEGIRITEIKKLAEVFDSNPKATFYAEIYWDAHIKTVQYNNGAYTCTYTADSAASGTGSYKVEKSSTALYNNVHIHAKPLSTP